MYNCIRSNTRVQSKTQSKEIIQPQRLPHLLMIMPTIMPINVPTLSVVDEDATICGRKGKWIIVIQIKFCIYITSLMFIKVAPKLKKKHVSSA